MPQHGVVPAVVEYVDPVGLVPVFRVPMRQRQEVSLSKRFVVPPQWLGIRHDYVRVLEVRRCVLRQMGQLGRDVPRVLRDRVENADAPEHKQLQDQRPDRLEVVPHPVHGQLLGQVGELDELPRPVHENRLEGTNPGLGE